ncbi:cupin domain-containing protein [Streptomyces cinnabarinus]|uniref:Cupin domain-containing protein n=1 Tax=Streptomyces cinnabarinus TaxID=67287 RepID=A0ABY7K9L9_9ACTN|nr:cupin domain-containing protein [Streptomyces cinnabarinus]WAZ19639.1 cupin domain-containing protein [Streptomyces cinnabarinus]
MTDLMVPAGAWRKLVTPAQSVTFRATKEMGSSVSVFEVIVPPGFDVGAHVHQHSQEFFYVLDGELDLLCFEPVKRTGDTWHHWESAKGDRVVRAAAGSCMFVPPGTPHAFRNATDKPVKMLFESFPSPAWNAISRASSNTVAKPSPTRPVDQVWRTELADVAERVAYRTA